MTSAPLKILIADADSKVVEAVSEYFSRAIGAHVFIAESGQAALTIISNVKPDVLLLEFMLPGMDGMALCKLLRGDEQTRHIPIIFLTTKDDVVDRVLGLESGASDYITKPFSLRELEARIKAVLRDRQAPQTGTRSPFEIKRVGGEWVEGGAVGRYFRGRYQLFVADEPVEQVEVTSGGEAAGGEESVWFTINVPNLEAFVPIGECSFDQIPVSVEGINLRTTEGVEFLRYVHVRRAHAGLGELVFSLHPDLWDWQRSYSPGQYFRKLTSILSIFRYWVEVELNEPEKGLSEGLCVRFFNLSANMPLSMLLEECIDTLRNAQAELNENLTDEERATLVSRFNFPDGLKVPCEQYLLYFGQFLHDLGVEATTDLRHEAGQVMFSVTPTDKEEALDKIREALMMYLGMSASPINNLDTLDYEIAIQRLVAEVQTLQSRVTLARAELQLKEATIQQQQIAIDTLRTHGSSLMLESLSEVRPEPKKNDREEIIEGLVAVKKFEWKFIEVGVPEMFRRLRQQFRKKDE